MWYGDKSRWHEPPQEHHLDINVASSLGSTVAAAAEQSCASFEIGHGQSGTWFLASEATRLAGHLVVHFVTGPIVGDRRFPGRQCWGRKILPLPPTIPCRTRRLAQFFQIIVNSMRVRQSCASRRVQFPKSCVCTTLRRPFGLLLRQRRILFIPVSLREWEGVSIDGAVSSISGCVYSSHVVSFGVVYHFSEHPLVLELFARNVDSDRTQARGVISLSLFIAMVFCTLKPLSVWTTKESRLDVGHHSSATEDVGHESLWLYCWTRCAQGTCEVEPGYTPRKSVSSD